MKNALSYCMLICVFLLFHKDTVTASRDNKNKEAINESLLRAVKSGKSVQVKTLLDTNADIAAKDEDAFTALHWAACVGGREEIIKMLLHVNADLNARNNEGNTPLHIAYKQGYLSTARTLLEAKADPNICNNQDDNSKDLVLKMQMNQAGVTVGASKRWHGYQPEFDRGKK